MNEEERATRRAAIEEIKKARRGSAIPESVGRSKSHAMPKMSLCPTPFCNTVTIRGTLCSMCARPVVNDVIEEKVLAESPLPAISHARVEPRPTSPVAWFAICIMLALTMAAAYMQKHEEARSEVYRAD